jgi:hypothetical protein
MFRTGRFEQYPEEMAGYMGEMLEEIDKLQNQIYDHQIQKDKHFAGKEMMLPPNEKIPEGYYSNSTSQKVHNWILEQADREEKWTFPVWELRIIEHHLKEFTKKEVGTHVTRVVEEKISIEDFEIMELIDLNSGYSCDQTKSRNKAIDYSVLADEDAKVYQYNTNRVIQEEAIVEFFTRGKGKKILGGLTEDTRNKIIANSL